MSRILSERELSEIPPERMRMILWLERLIDNGPKMNKIKSELDAIRIVIDILKQREQELQAEYDKLMEAA